MSEKPGKLLLLGFGDINQRLARILVETQQITAARRSAFTVSGMNCQQGDVTNHQFVDSLLHQNPQQIVITLSPSEYSEQGYIATYLNAVQTLVTATDNLGLTPEVVFISSSSVYHHDRGERVNERTACEPARHNGRILLKAEDCLLQSGLTATVIRFSGIYGPGRYRLLSNSLSAEHHQPEIVHWTNRIHAEDCARAIKHVLALPTEARETTYLASDTSPVPAHVVKGWLFNQMHRGKKHATEEHSKEYTEYTDAELSQFIDLQATGKRCDNSRLLASGFELRYPTYKEGFLPVIDGYRQENPDLA